MPEDGQEEGGGGDEDDAGVRREADLREALDAMRILLAPVLKRQREKAAERAGAKGKGSKKPLNINIPLHGPRVEIVLAWMAAVFLCELDAVA